ncbi:MAG: CdaR family protein [Tepidiformaceae bacterium]
MSAATRLRLVRRLVFGSVGSLYQHWALGLFSLVAAMGIWFVIQDVENPRIEGRFPRDPGTLEAIVKNNNDFIVRDMVPVSLTVDARKGDFTNLRREDFEVYVDLAGVEVGGPPASLPVRATSKRDGVRVLGVTPSTMRVTVVEAQSKEVPVIIRRTGELPAGYRESPDADPAVEPAFVTVRGAPELVSTVKNAELVVNLAGTRSETLVADGDLTPRTESGSDVTVKLSQSRARVTIKIEQTFVQRTLSVTPAIFGVPAPGYRIVNITSEPASVVLNGPTTAVGSIQLGLSTERVDVSGAKSDVVVTRNIDQPPNTFLDRRSVTVKVEIKPIECSVGTGVPCGAVTFFIAPDIGPPPAGLVRDTSGAGFTADIRVSGPLSVIKDLLPSAFKVTVSLAGGAVGTATYPVVVVPPPGLNIKVEPVDPVVIVLKAVTP